MLVFFEEYFSGYGEGDMDCDDTERNVEETDQGSIAKVVLAVPITVVSSEPRGIASLSSQLHQAGDADLETVPNLGVESTTRFGGESSVALVPSGGATSLGL
ncbi:unnamed protein product [Calypogeia fissa]